MIDRNLISLMYEKGHSYAFIGKTLNVSRQRIHQIIKKYHNHGKPDRERKYINKEICIVCNLPASALHHKDFDNSNDEEDNLIGLCKKCHYQVHCDARKENKKLRRKFNKWSRKYPWCQICGTNKIPYDARGLCENCYQNFYLNRIKKGIY